MAGAGHHTRDERATPKGGGFGAGYGRLGAQTIRHHTREGRDGTRIHRDGTRIHRDDARIHRDDARIQQPDWFG